MNPLTTPSVTAAVLSNGRIGFQIGGAVGPDYAVQSSTDLVVWISRYITNSPTPPFNWADTNGAVFAAGILSRQNRPAAALKGPCSRRAASPLS